MQTPEPDGSRSEKPGTGDGEEALLPLCTIIARLRGPEGCAFDRQQTLPSLLEDLREEVYELSDAITQKNLTGAAGEIADLLTVLLFMREILQEQNGLSLTDLFKKATDKMIRRHPHVFSEPDPGKNVQAIWETWETIKKTEEEHQDRKSLLDGVPRSMPALDAAQKLGKKAGRVGFDWPSADDAWEKVIEEVGELSEARHESLERTRQEYGDLLLALSSYGRHLGIRAEEALSEANGRFRDRFHQMEQAAAASGTSLSSLTALQWDRLWVEAKQKEGSGNG